MTVASCPHSRNASIIAGASSVTLLPPDFTVHVFACLEKEAAAVIPDNKARSVVADWLSILHR